MLTKTLQKSLVLAAVVGSLGCLGGGGGGGGGSTPPNPDPGPSPLNVTSATINTVQGEQDLTGGQTIQEIDIQANLVQITIQFNKSLGALIKNSMNATADDIHLTYMGSGGANSAALNIDVSGSEALVTPKLDLRPSTTYTVVVKAGIVALDGATLNSGKNYSFRTKDTPPSEIDEYIITKWVPAGTDTDNNPITEDGFRYWAGEKIGSQLAEHVQTPYRDVYVTMNAVINNPDNLELQEGQMGKRFHRTDFNFELGKSYVVRMTAYLLDPDRTLRLYPNGPTISESSLATWYRVFDF